MSLNLKLVNMKYFYNYTITEINLPEQGYKVGTDINENNTFIPLSEKQLEFLEENPNASTMEIWNCVLTPIIPIQEPTPEELFDFYKCTSDLRIEFGMRMLEIEQYSQSILMNLQLKNFDLVKQIALGHVQLGHMTNSDYEKICNVLAKQNIVL